MQTRKSLLAIEHAYRVREAHPKTWVFWVHASNAARFEESYKKIAERVQLPGWNEPYVDILGIVYEWLSNENNGRWTMVVDNENSPKMMFEPWDDGIYEQIQQRTTSSSTGRSPSDNLPTSANGSIVITSRSQKAVERLTGWAEDIFEVKQMGEEMAVAVLRKNLKRHDGDLVDLVQQLNCMPLAITQAVAYTNQRAPRSTVSILYLETLKRNYDDRAQLLQIALLIRSKRDQRRTQLSRHGTSRSNISDRHRTRRHDY